jgi:hypothetical protein
MRLLEKNRGNTSEYCSGQEFFDNIFPKAQETKAKIDKWDFIK